MERDRSARGDAGIARGQFEDPTGDGPDLFGCIGDRHDPAGGSRPSDGLQGSVGRPDDSGGFAAAENRLVGVGYAGDAEHHRRPRRLVEHPIQEPPDGRCDRGREEPHDMAERCHPLAQIGPFGGGEGQVVFGVEAGEVASDRPVEGDRGPGLGGIEFGDRLETDLVDVGQLGEECREGRLGGLVVSDPLVGARFVTQDAPHRRSQHGIGDGSGVEQQVGPDEFDQLERGDEGNVRDSPERSDRPEFGRPQESTGRQPHEVAGDHHRDRRQRVRDLGRADDGMQGPGGRSPIGHDVGGLDHGMIVGRACDING